MENEQYRDESRAVAADIVIALAMCAVAALGSLAAFAIVELARLVA